MSAGRRERVGGDGRESAGWVETVGGDGRGSAGEGRRREEREVVGRVRGGGEWGEGGGEIGEGGKVEESPLDTKDRGLLVIQLLAT